MRSLRVACHVHSAWSYDGRLSLKQVVRMFAGLGYDAVLAAEHDRGFDETRWRAYRDACARASTAEMSLIPGIEYSDASNSVHVPVWGDIPFLGAGLPTDALLARAERAGGVAVLAHPGRRRVLASIDESLLQGLAGIELWNRKYDGYAPNLEAAGLLRGRPELIPIVGLDLHSIRQLHPLSMRFEIEDGDDLEAGICEAFRRRNVRATAFGRDAMSLAEGRAAAALGRLERARRETAKHLRTPVPVPAGRRRS